nr:retrovirus-related Pol polyprotein from transposon TNT 1-94 [Tanacetum cinerariifolium]
MEAIRFTHTSEDEIENQVLKVIATNEPDIPHTEDTEGPPDLINTEGTRKQNVQNDQMITQPTDVPLGNNNEVLGSISESLILDVTQSHISNQASTMATIKAIRIFLAFATYMNFKVYQIDVKSAFLNGKLKEKVYVKQPLGFESSEFPNYVYKLDKALYGLKQAPKARYETLSTFLIQNKFTIGRIDNTLSIYKSKVDVLLVQVYVDDIIFGSTSYKLCKQFEKLMTKKLEMGPDLAGKPVNETSYRGMIRYLKGTPTLGLYYSECSGFDLKGYSDSDYASCNMDRKSTLGLTSTASDEGTTKTTPHLEGPLVDKDSGGNKPPANMEPINPSFVDPSGTSAKYQVDHTQSTRLRYQSLTENKGKLLYERELDTQPLVLSTYANDRAFLLSDDEAQESEKDILGAGEEMNEDPHTASITETHHQSPPLQADKPQSSYAPSTEASDTDSYCDEILKKYNNALPLAKRQLLGENDGGSGELDGGGCESMYSIFGNGSSSGCHGGLWWLIEDEEDGEVGRRAIRLFLAYASFMGFMVYHMDVKSAFMYGTIEEEVYVCQPTGYEDPDYPDKVYKVVKALYELHQDPRAWYETLANYILENGFQRGKIDQTLLIKKQKVNERQGSDESIGELTFFLGLQVKQKPDGIFISQDKYVAKILRKFGLTDGKSASTPIDTEKPLLKDPNVAYSDSDYAGESLDRKSTTGGCQFFGCRLISWQCKKQTIVATSSTKAEYVAA